jgi:hypothetical protein
MRKWRTLTAIVVLMAGLGAACGTESTGVSVGIEPDPVQATREADGSYGASWDAVIADLTGVGGTVESITANVMGATAATVNAGRINPPGARLPSDGMAVAPFARRLISQSAHFSTAGQSVTVQVTVRFRDDNGVTYDQTAEARVSLR